jgi:hypothetical protein
LAAGGRTHVIINHDVAPFQPGSGGIWSYETSTRPTPCISLTKGAHMSRDEDFAVLTDIQEKVCAMPLGSSPSRLLDTVRDDR